MYLMRFVGKLQFVQWQGTQHWKNRRPPTHPPLLHLASHDPLLNTPPHSVDRLACQCCCLWRCAILLPTLRRCTPLASCYPGCQCVGGLAAALDLLCHGHTLRGAAGHLGCSQSHSCIEVQRICHWTCTKHIPHQAVGATLILLFHAEALVR
jgi:hypothetical protein